MQAELTGSTEFQAWTPAKQSPYSIFAAQTSIDTVVKELSKRFKVEDWHQNIERQGTLADLSGVPIVKMKGSPWAIAYWSINRYQNLKRDCISLSEKIDGRVIQLWKTDNSDWLEWLVHDKGEEREGCERERRNTEKADLRSTLRQVPKLKKLNESWNQKLTVLVDELLTGQGLEIPAGNWDLSDDRIERVDVLVLPSQPLGMWDFQTWIHEGHPEYSIFAIKAPIDEVGQAMAQYCKGDEWQKTVQSSSPLWDVLRAKDQNWMPLVQPKNSDWTAVYWCVGGWRDCAKKLQKLSTILDTLAIGLAEADTAGTLGYELFDRGQRVEQLDYCDEIFFESELQDEPEFDDFEDSEWDTVSRFINARFSEEGIYIPTWQMAISDEWMGRVDLMKCN
jgi:hypothetical protein